MITHSIIQRRKAMKNLEVSTMTFRGKVQENLDSSGDKSYTVSLVAEDGPVVTAKTEAEAKKLFEKAVNLYCTMKSLLAFKRAFYSEEKSQNVGDLFKDYEYEYESVS